MYVVELKLIPFVSNMGKDYQVSENRTINRCGGIFIGQVGDGTMLFKGINRCF